MYILAHVGDSSAYHYRDGKLNQITDDHSFVGELIREGHLPEEAYYVHPRRNVITRALGQMPYISVDLYTDFLQENDRLLICTDGLWEMVRDDELSTVLANPIFEDIPSELVEAANLNGGADNIGLVVGEINQKIT